VTPKPVFGPTALLTPANVLTIIRIFSSAGLVALVVSDTEWWAFCMFIAIGITDNIDGMLARRQGTTRSGAFLDPLADKVYIGSVAVTLAVQDKLSWAIVSLLLSREILVSIFRSWAAGRGGSVPASAWGKLKTFVTVVGLGALLLPVSWSEIYGHLLLWVAVALAWISAAGYLRRAPSYTEKGPSIDVG